MRRHFLRVAQVLFPLPGRTEELWLFTTPAGRQFNSNGYNETSDVLYEGQRNGGGNFWDFMKYNES